MDILELLEANNTVENIVSTLVVIGEYETKTAARIAVENVIEENDLVVTKPVSKAQALKDAFLALEDPIILTKKELKKLVEEYGHKAGSVAYYVNAYSLAIELTKKITTAEEIAE